MRFAVAQGRSVAARAQVDPEAKYRRYGKDFGKAYKYNDQNWMERAPQVRVRVAGDRGKEQLAELAVLNERLKGQAPAWQLRNRVEYLKRKRVAWESVYNAATRHETALTLEYLENSIAQVEETLAEGANEFRSIADAKAELLALQAEVQDAHRRLHVTQGRVEQNVKRVSELKAEAAEFARVNQMSTEEFATAAQMSTHPEVVEATTPLAAPTRSSTGASTRPAATPAAPLEPRVSKKSRGLASTMNLEPGLRNFWYAVSFSSKLKPDMLVPVQLFGEAWVLFRDEAGRAACVYDECAHRACPLSLGSVENGQVQCPYHGWTFNSQGVCTKMPSTVQCRGIQVAHLPTEEKDGFVWVWAGDAAPVAVPDTTLPPGNFVLHAEIEVEVPVEHGLLMENLLDLAHAPFTHTGTFAKGWPVPEAVRFHTQRILAGNWDPYPIDMSFEPPCMVVSMIGLKKPGQIEAGARAMECKNHLHQLHVCLPARRGHTRLLYRMSLDFMPWIRYVPGIQAFWKYIAGQVLGEDLVLVEGQQRRLEAGGDTWSHPVSYDKLAVRYRRWRNDVGDATVPTPAMYAQQSMNAGDLFAVEDDGDVYVDDVCPIVDFDAPERGVGA